MVTGWVSVIILGTLSRHYYAHNIGPCLFGTYAESGPSQFDDFRNYF